MKKIVLSALVIVLAIGLVGGGAFAYLSDTETSTGNTFTAGTMDLKIWGGNPGWGDVGPVGEWEMSNMAPGAATATDSGRVDLRHAGTISAHHLEVGCSYTATEGAPTGDMDTVDQDLEVNWDDFARYVEITHFDYHDGIHHIKYTKGPGYFWAGAPQPDGCNPDVDWQIADKNGDGIISLYDLKYDPLDNLPPPGPGVGDVTFEMDVRFHAKAGSDLQGDTLDATITFTLNQEAGQ